MHIIIKKICINNIGDIKGFGELIKSHPSLIGHIIYREFGDKQMFEEYRTPFVYDKIFEGNIDFPIYSILPKGELGINPNIDSARVKVFEATYDSEKNKIIPRQELNLKLSTKLISEKKCTIR